MRRVTFKLLVAANLFLLAWLVLGLNRPAGAKGKSVSFEPSRIAAVNPESTNGLGPAGAAQLSGQSRESRQKPPRAETSFAHVYSSNPKEFAANLRAIHCPEQTINDILTAEVHWRFRAQEE